MIDVERLYIGYNFSKEFALRLGRFHTPIGYFTRVWHHGLYLMTPLYRPKLIEFHGGPTPIHLIGLEAEGKFSAPLNPGYVLDFGNGNLHFGSDNIIDFDKYKSFVGKFFISPIDFSEIGIFGGYDPFEFSENGTKTIIRNSLFGLNIAYNKPGGPQAILEGFLFREFESEKNGFGGFLLISYPALNIEGLIMEIRPYLMFDFISWDDGNLWFDKLTEKFGLTKETRLSAGVKFSITPEVAIKLEYSFHNITKAENFSTIGIAFGFGLPVF